MEEETLTPKPAKRRFILRRAPAIIAVLVLLALAMGGAVGSAATVYWTMTQRTPTPVAIAAPMQALVSRQVGTDTAETNITTIYKAVSPAVVSVTSVTGSSRSRGTLPQREAGGTGFMVNDQGYVLTNNHVVQGASTVTITLLDGTTRNATVAGTDAGSDLAVLKADIPKDKIVVVPLGDSSQVEPGQVAIAIGNPFGLDHTVTSGIISAVNREFGTASGRPMRGLIQTDAPINPGNSGGPLFNANGEVIGITTSIESPVQGSVGIGFAIPINNAKALLPQLQSGQKVEHTYLGIQGVAITSDIAQQHSLPVLSGVWVALVVADGPAAKAGLKGGGPNSDVPVGGDIITAIDSRPVKTVPDLSGYIDTRAVGDTVTLTVIRNGNTIKVPVTLAAWPASVQG